MRLYMEYYPYERYTETPLKRVRITGADLRECLIKMVRNMGWGLYLSVETIEEENMTPEDIIESLKSTNGDGCDFINRLKNEDTGEVYIDEGWVDEEEDW